MLTQFYSDQKTLERLRNEVIGTYLDGFVRWLVDQRYSAATIRSYVPMVVCFARWLNKSGMTCRIPGKENLDSYRDHLVNRGCLHRGNRYCAARRFVRYLESIGLQPVLTQTVLTDSALLGDFLSWIREYRGLADATISGYRLVVRDLIDTIGEHPARYTAMSLRSFVLNRARRYGGSKAQSIVTSVRMFVRFLISTSLCSESLEHAIPRFARWRRASLPRYLSAEDIDRIISYCDPSTPIGARDRAIILLLARLGLRASDVAGLNLNHVDWEKGRLLVSGKNRRLVWLPLTQDAGDAILDYIRFARPSSNYDRLFLLSRAPYTPINVRQISQTAQRAILRSGVNTRHQGAHVFRHSVATAMLRQGASLESIGALLRHSSIETTTIYAKVDIEMLKEIAIPWPEVTP